LIGAFIVSDNKLELFRELGIPTQKAMERLFDYLVSQEACVSEVRSSYISFSIDGEMVAVAQRGDEGIDIAMALPFDGSDARVFDALDLKWRTLPTGIVIVGQRDVGIAKKYLKTACSRVRNGERIEIDGASYKRPEGTFQPQFKKFKRQ